MAQFVESRPSPAAAELMISLSFVCISSAVIPGMLFFVSKQRWTYSRTASGKVVIFLDEGGGGGGWLELLVYVGPPKALRAETVVKAGANVKVSISNCM